MIRLLGFDDFSFILSNKLHRWHILFLLKLGDRLNGYLVKVHKGWSDSSESSEASLPS